MTTINDGKIRFGLVGFGRVAQNHIKAMQTLENDIDLVAICETQTEAHAQIKESIPQAKIHTNLKTMLEQEDLDIVTLCTPSGLHSEQAISIASAQTNVLTEKPMATTLSDGQAMIKACETNNVKLYVVKQNRFNPTCQKVKKAIEQGRFGRIYMVTSNVFWTRPQEYYDSANWRGTWKMDGGAFMNQASHYVDMVLWLINEKVTSIYGSTATMARQIETEDTGIAVLNWKSGCIGSINVTMLTYPKNLEGSITILGEKGTVKIGGVALNQIEHWEFADKRPEDEDINSSSYETTSVYGHGHTTYYENIVKALRDEPTDIVVDGYEGIKSLEVLDAIYRSQKSKEKVTLS